MSKLIDKPWGSEKIIEVNENYVVKQLYMKTGCRCSLQKHLEKHETIYVISGILKLTVNKKDIEMKAGDFHVIPPNTIHRMSGVKNAIYIECSTPQLDDVVRLEDDYNRK